MASHGRCYQCHSYHGDEMSTVMLGPPCGYTDLLDYEIELEAQKQLEAKREGKGKFPLTPSSSGFCARRLAYDLMEYRGHAVYESTPITPQLYRLFELGHAIEYQSLKTFKLLKVFTQKYKQQVLTFFPIERGIEGLKADLMEGQCDFVFWNEKYKCIGDVKSKKDKFSYAYKTNWDEELDRFDSMDSLVRFSDTAFYADNLDAFIEELGDDFLTDNLYQLNLYAMSDFMKERGIDHCILYRYNKNDSRHMEIRFRPSEKAFNYVRDKYNKINVAVDKKQPESVEKEYFLGSSRCAFCSYNKMCWGDTNALKEHFKTMPGKKWPTDIYKIEDSKDVENDFAEYEDGIGAASTLKKKETKIIKWLLEKKINKIRLLNGHIYELKMLKTPTPHYELRRGKL